MPSFPTRENPAKHCGRRPSAPNHENSSTRFGEEPIYLTGINDRSDTPYHWPRWIRWTWRSRSARRQPGKKPPGKRLRLHGRSGRRWAVSRNQRNWFAAIAEAMTWLRRAIDARKEPCSSYLKRCQSISPRIKTITTTLVARNFRFKTCVSPLASSMTDSPLRNGIQVSR
jgi:hypothetical protein